MSRIVFMGTPESAIPTLSSLVERHGVDLVVTQPDRPRGRSKSPVPPPVAEAAVDMGLRVAQPGSRAELQRTVEDSKPWDVGVVVAYGRILPPETLAIPRLGYLNVHFSLLPRWRGAAPVQRAIMAGDTMTGVTIIRLDEGLDTGPVLTAQALDVAAMETAGTLQQRLAQVGARLLSSSLPAYVSGDLRPVAQSDEGVTYAEKIEQADRHLSLSTSADRFVDHVRALAPEPGAVLTVDGEPFQVMEASVVESGPEQGRWSEVNGDLVVGLESGSVKLVVVRPPGRKEMAASDWLRGARRNEGTVG